MAKIKVLTFESASSGKGLRTTVQDTKGRLWERYEEWPMGQWGPVILPEEPVAGSKRRKKR
jgi:hypothetical protein